MFVKTQDGRIINLALCTEIYKDKQNGGVVDIWTNFSLPDGSWETIILGTYSAQEAELLFDTLVDEKFTFPPSTDLK